MRSALSLATALAIAGCRPGESPHTPANGAEAGAPEPAPGAGLRGVLVGSPAPKPDFSLTTMEGERFDFRRDTEGYLTLLFFGYTNCPDVCPVHMANIGRVLKGLRIEVARRVRVVFVTTDPERDTPERLRTWLANFHPDFIGLSGTEDELREAQLAVGMPPAGRSVPDSTRPATYYVSHGAQVFAFTTDNLAHVVYPFGIRQQDWANDIPMLVAGWPSPTRPAGR